MAYSDADVRDWITTIDLVYTANVPDELLRDADDAADNMLSAADFRDISGDVHGMIKKLLGAGYAQALKDVRDGMYDAQIEYWRPDLQGEATVADS